MPYVRLSVWNTSASTAPARVLKPPEPSNAADAGAGRSGSVTSMICTPSSYQEAAAAYARPPAPYTATSRAPSRAPNPPEPSDTADMGAGRSGSVTSMICTSSSYGAATTAYARPPASYASTSYAPYPKPNPSNPSDAAYKGAGRSGSVMSIVCTTASPTPTATPYARPAAPYTATPSTLCMAPNPPEPSNTADTGTGRAGSATSII